MIVRILVVGILIVRILIERGRPSRYLVPIKEIVGLSHPDGLFIVSRSRTGSIVKGTQIAIAAILEIAVTAIWTAAVIYTIGLQCISRLTWCC